MPFVPPEPPEPPSLQVPLPPPEVGFGSPWAPADAENRDRILDWWRAWWRRVFFPWLRAFLAWLQAWLDAAAEYITQHAVAGYSWRRTDTVIATSGTTDVEIIPFDEFRPLLVGDLVSDTSAAVSYGRITVVIDETHATVQYIGTLRGLRGETGSGLWTTVTPITHSGTTAVVLEADPDREPNVGDLVLDSTTEVAYGKIITVTDPTHVIVEYIGTLQGPAGIADAGVFDFTTPELTPAPDVDSVYQGLMAGQPNMVGAYVLTVTSPCWVRVYASEAYMLADAARGIMTPLNIADDHGCYLDFVGVPSELLKTLTPGIQFTDTGSGLWLSVQNTDDAPAEIGVHFDFRIFRE